MRVDRANRSFIVIAGIGLLFAAASVCGALGGVLVPLAAARMSRGQGDQGTLLVSLAVLVSIAWGMGLGIRALVRQGLSSLTLARHLRAVSSKAPEALARAARQAGLAGRVALVDAADSFSFVYGAITPRVVVSRGLLEGATAQELRAVLEHERYHVRNLDPLKAVTVRALSDALFFLPALSSLRARYVAGRELAADRRAIAVCGRHSLAAALLKVARSPEWSEQAGVAAIAGQDLLDVRLQQLETGLEPRPQALDAESIVLSLAGVVSLVVVFLVAVSCLGGTAAVHHATGAGSIAATWLDALRCAAPFAVAGLMTYSLLALRASRPLRS